MIGIAAGAGEAWRGEGTFRRQERKRDDVDSTNCTFFGKYRRIFAGVLDKCGIPCYNERRPEQTVAGQIIHDRMEKGENHEKIALLTVLALLLSVFSLTAFAADNTDKDTLTNLTVGEAPDFDHPNMNHWDFSYNFTPDESLGQYVGDIGAGSYVYLKAPNDVPGTITKTFTVDTDGTYDFSICLMSYLYEGQDAQPPRTGLVQIDDGEKYYIGAVHTTHMEDEWYTGITENLTAGEHTITLYLASDFDNSAVKSCYFKSFAYIDPNAPIVTDPVDSVPGPDFDSGFNGPDTAPEGDDEGTEAGDESTPEGSDKQTDKQESKPDTGKQEKPEEKGGCGGLIAGAALPMMLCAAALVLKKRK